MNKKLYIIPIALFLVTIPFILFAGENADFELDVSIFSGTSILNIKETSYNTKMVPVAGISLSSYFMAGQLFSYGFEFLYQYSFKSNYNNYYYYDSYHSFSLIPNIGLHLHRSMFSYYFLIGLGVSYSFSDYHNKLYGISSVGAGIKLKKSFIQAILLNYNHSFIKNYKTFETIKIYVSINVRNIVKKLHKTGVNKR